MSHNFATKKSRFIWRNLRNKQSSGLHFEAHLLVVKNASYVPIAQTCVESFFYWHPNSIIRIHCDEHTESKVRNLLIPRKHKGKILIESTYKNNDKTWQEQKLDLLISLNGSRDFFMDADLRWNGPLVKDLIRPIFFVKEFELKSRSPYRQLVHEKKYFQYQDSSMWNTSFFTFGGFTLEPLETRTIRELHKDLLNTINSELFGEFDKPSLIRIAEQLAISMSAELWKTKSDSLKSADGFKDGTFVESSYYGATGHTF